MGKPIILFVDDEPPVLNALERDLRGHYGSTYRIVKAGSGIHAMKAVENFKRRNDSIALFIVDQRMPEMTGLELLAEAIKFYPGARRVLLTAYADTEAAIAGINSVGLDYYFKKPWDPPEDNLFPVLDDLLGDWWATAELPYEGIRVAGTLWSADSHRCKDFLARNRIPYQWLDIDEDADARLLVETAAGGGPVRLPVIFFPDGVALVNPDNRDLADKVGLQTEATEAFYDLIIVGAGPAGLGAAVYAASEGIQCLLLDREATGGQAGTSSKIENYLGFPSGISGADLARRATAQAKRLGAEILTAREVTAVRVEDPYRYIVLSDGTEIGCRAMIIATGVTTKELEVPGVKELTGKGIYYGAALTEAANFEGEHIHVVGGANSAGQAAMYFARYASKVTMLVRGSSLTKSMSQYLIDPIGAAENIEVVSRTAVTAVQGSERLEAITTQNIDSGESASVSTPALFLFIGAVPHSDFVADVVQRNHAGFIPTGPDLLKDGKKPDYWKLRRYPYLLETSVPGIFAAGDIRQGVTRRVASAVGQGGGAIGFVRQYLRTV
jgi:thioredoxin reductase (NADPH)